MELMSHTQIDLVTFVTLVTLVDVSGSSWTLHGGIMGRIPLHVRVNLSCQKACML